jgi:hypothetical protein
VTGFYCLGTAARRPVSSDQFVRIARGDNDARLMAAWYSTYTSDADGSQGHTALAECVLLPRSMYSRATSHPHHSPLNHDDWFVTADDHLRLE